MKISQQSDSHFDRSQHSPSGNDKKGKDDDQSFVELLSLG